MASIYDLKPRFQALLRPLVQRLADRGVTANQVTMAAFGLSAVCGALIWLTGGHLLVLWLVPVVLFLRMAMNAVDGMLAREHGQQSELGMLLNELTDPGADAVLYLPFMAIAGLSPILVALVVAAGIIVELAGILAPMLGVERRYDGPFGKSDRALAFGMLAVILALGYGGTWLNAVLVLMLVLAIWTIVRRCRAALSEEY